MNARQKAKHYKHLLEKLSPKVNTVYIDRTELTHLRTCYKVLPDYYYEHMTPEEKQVRVELEAKHQLLHDLRNVVDTYTKLEVNELGEELYALDIWVKY